MYANVSVLVSVLEKEQGLGLGLATSCLGLGLGLATACLGLGLDLAGQGLGLVKKCLGHITGISTAAIRGTAADALQVDCGEPPLQIRRRQLQLKYGIKVKNENNHINSHLLEDHWTNYWGKYKIGEEPWVNKIKCFLEKMPTFNPQIEEPNEVPPWRQEWIETDILLKGTKIEDENKI
jgi:hypothetical protein